MFKKLAQGAMPKKERIQGSFEFRQLEVNVKKQAEIDTQYDQDLARNKEIWGDLGHFLAIACNLITKLLVMLDTIISFFLEDFSHLHASFKAKIESLNEYILPKSGWILEIFCIFGNKINAFE